MEKLKENNFFLMLGLESKLCYFSFKNITSRKIQINQHHALVEEIKITLQDPLEWAQELGLLLFQEKTGLSLRI